MSEVKYEIVKELGVLSNAGPALSRAEGSGWTRERKLISWNDREPK